MTVLVKDWPESQVASLLREAERFVFLVSHACNRRSDTGDSEFLRLAGQLYRDESSLANVIAEIRERTDRHFSFDRFRVEVSEFFKQEGEEGFYSWDGLAYFLFEYETKLKGRNATTKINWEDFTRSKRDHITIEHIYPKTPKKGEWTSFDAHSSKDKFQLKHSLGNLLALSRHKNSSLSNRSFSEKKQSDDGIIGYFNGSYSENDVARLDDWTPKQVLDRGLLLLAFLEQRWMVSLGSRSDKLNLLQLGFLDSTNS